MTSNASFEQIQNGQFQPQNVFNPSVNADFKDFFGQGFLHYAAKGNQPHMIIAYLFRKVHSFPNALVKYPQLNGNIDSLEKFAQFLQQAGVTNPYSQGDVKAASNDFALFDFLKEIGFDANTPSNVDDTPLHLAVSNNKTMLIIDVLKSLGADINIKNLNGRTPLHCAVFDKSVDSVSKLLEYSNIDKNATDNAGDSVTHYAASANSVSMLQILQSKGVNFNVVNAAGKKPIQIASEHGNIQAYEYLLNNKT